MTWKYGEIDREKYKHLDVIWVYRTGGTGDGDSDIEIRQEQTDPLNDYFCIQCPLSNDSPMSAVQLLDHIELVHMERGDVIFQPVYEDVKEWARQYRENKRAAKAAVTDDDN